VVRYSESKKTVTILKTMIVVESKILICDTIRYEDKLWLVPLWLENKVEGLKMPARIIRIDTLKYQKLPVGSGSRADFVLNDPLPKSLLNCHVQPPTDFGYEFVDAPEIYVSTRSKEQDA